MSGLVRAAFGTLRPPMDSRDVLQSRKQCSRYSNCGSSPSISIYNPKELITGQWNTADWTDVPVISGYPVGGGAFYLGYKIDPQGVLFGRDPCGWLNYTFFFRRH
jgi:hypothetical protein